MVTNAATDDGTGSQGTALPIRLAILDDQELLLDSMVSWIGENAPEFEVVVRAETWVDLVRSPSFPTPLVLMNFQLSEPVSLEARIRTCRAAGAKVIVMSAHDEGDVRDRAIGAGAAAFVPKTESMQALHAVARRVMELHDGTGPAPAPSAGDSGQGESAAGAPNADVIRPKLSRGELEALRLYVAGNTTVAVAQAMNVKYETAKTYLRRVRDKYAKANRPASRRADLIMRAAEDGYLQ